MTLGLAPTVFTIGVPERATLTVTLAEGLVGIALATAVQVKVKVVAEVIETDLEPPDSGEIAGVFQVELLGEDVCVQPEAVTLFVVQFKLNGAPLATVAGPERVTEAVGG